MKDKAEIKEALSNAGRALGLKGGPARAKALSKERRSEIATKAVEERWRKVKSRTKKEA